MSPESVNGPVIHPGERIAVLGMARSGFAAAKLCVREGASVIGLDIARPSGFDREMAELEEAGVRFAFGPHPESLLDSIDRIVKSPGVPGTISFVNDARRRGIPIWGEIELASRFARGPILGISGTNGKSTTTAWAADMLARCGRRCELVGNIGRPIADGVLSAAQGAILVTEISSFQLEDTQTFHPKGAALLNLTPDHLDRHGNLEAYREAKLRLFSHQTADDHAVLGEQDDLADEIRRRFQARILRFRLEDRGEEGAFLREGLVGIRLGKRERILCPAAEIPLPGPHNRANALAALALLAPFGLPGAGLRDSLCHFAGLPHRLERVAEVDGVLYVNDSKATNADSLVTALAAFEQPIVLLAGGRGKGQDFRPLARLVASRCRVVLLFGEAAEDLRFAWGADLCSIHADLAGALARAREVARPGDVVLLSPACSSFDQFAHYEERGARFRDLVRGLESAKETE